MKMSKELEEKIYSMSNSFLPLDVFYNDIRDNPIENFEIMLQQMQELEQKEK